MFSLHITQAKVQLCIKNVLIKHFYQLTNRSTVTDSSMVARIIVEQSEKGEGLKDKVKAFEVF